jgi:hypothetical protein
MKLGMIDGQDVLLFTLEYHFHLIPIIMQMKCKVTKESCFLPTCLLFKREENFHLYLNESSKITLTIN